MKPRVFCYYSALFPWACDTGTGLLSLHKTWEKAMAFALKRHTVAV
jgi:hypothetical protein